MEETKKLVRVYKKITVKEVYVFEIPKTEYETIGKKENGHLKYGYVEHPTEKEKTESSETLYEQKFEDDGLVVNDLVLWANRVK